MPSTSAVLLSLAGALVIAGCVAPEGVHREIAAEPVAGPATPLVLDGTADRTQVVLARGQSLVVRLPSNRTTGYSWRSEGDPSPGVLRAVANEYVPTPRGADEPRTVGRGGVHVWAFEAVAPGTTQFRVGHYPPGGSEAADRFLVEVVVR